MSLHYGVEVLTVPFDLAFQGTPPNMPWEPESEECLWPENPAITQSLLVLRQRGCD